MNYIPYGHQDIDDNDINAVVRILKSDWLTQGPVIEEFEKAVADYCGAKYAVSVSSGTAALHIAMLAADLGTGDELWTSPNTFVASANCGLYCGANVDFVDIERKTFNMSTSCLEEKIKSAVKKNKLPKVIIPVHFAGQSCNMEKISEIAKKHNILLVEDGSHAIGGSYKEDKIGSCRYSDMTVFSFHPVKNITTGEGGMVLTNRKELYEKLKLFREHGITKTPSLIDDNEQGTWYYQQIVLGYNYRMTDIQAALGKSQLKRIDEFISRRRTIVDIYNEKLKNLGLGLPQEDINNNSAWHLYVIQLDLQKEGIDRRFVFNAMRKAGIGVNVHYIPVHTQPVYQKLGFKKGDYPEAEKYYEQAISLPIYPGLKKEQQDYVIETLYKLLQ